jgi:hypothetical protein
MNKSHEILLTSCICVYVNGMSYTGTASVAIRTRAWLFPIKTNNNIMHGCDPSLFFFQPHFHNEIELIDSYQRESQTISLPNDAKGNAQANVQSNRPEAFFCRHATVDARHGAISLRSMHWYLSANHMSILQ